MAVALLLITFVAFALIDWLLSRKQAMKIATAASPAATPAPAPQFLQPSIIEGFAVPEQLRYHQGHGWICRERKNVARVGADEFAAVIAGQIEAIELPKPGQWIRQGQKAWTLKRGQESTEMISPIEGEVVEINKDVLADPTLLRTDPYGRGWLMTVHVPDEETSFRNLVPKTSVGSWMRESVARLWAVQPQLAGVTAADGGRPADDLFNNMPDAEWKAVTTDLLIPS